MALAGSKARNALASLQSERDAILGLPSRFAPTAKDIADTKKKLATQRDEWNEQKKQRGIGT